MPDHHRTQRPAELPSHSDRGGSQRASPEAVSVLKLQHEAGNRAVASAAASGELWGMATAQYLPAVQRAPAAPPGEGKSDDGAKTASAITGGLRRAIDPYRMKMQHLPPAEADMWIGIIAAYTNLHPAREDRSFLFAEPEDLYELLAPWGFAGRSAQYDPTSGRLVALQDVETLAAAIGVWQGEDARTRKKRRSSAPSTMGSYDRQVDMTEAAYADSQVVTGPNRSDPSDPWGPSYEGTRAARRSERQRLKNEHTLEMMDGIRNEGPGGLVGMIAGGIVGSFPGMDFDKSTEFGMQAGAMFDAPILAIAGKAPGEGGGDASAAGEGESAHVEKAGPREPMPTPDMPGSTGGGARGGTPAKTLPGRGAPGPAGEGALPRAPGPMETMPGMGVAGTARPGPGAPAVRSQLRAGPIVEASADAVIAQFKANPNRVRHSTSDYWHRYNWVEALKDSGQWSPEMGPAPEPPIAFRLKGGMMQVHDVLWKHQRGTLAEILQPHEVAGAPVAGGQGGAGGRAAGVRGGEGGGTQVGVPPGPGSTSAPSRASGKRTQVGVPRGPGAEDPASDWKVPSGPSPHARGNVVNPATVDEVKELFAKAPHQVVVGGDDLSTHQYIWEYQRWFDGRPTKEAAPAAFHLGHGRIRVSPTLWRKLGQDPMELVERRAPADSGTSAIGNAPTLPAGPGGPGSTQASIAPKR